MKKRSKPALHLRRNLRTVTVAVVAFSAAAWVASLPGHGGAPREAVADTTRATRLPANIPDEPVSVSRPEGATGGGVVAVAATAGSDVPAAALVAYQRAETIIDSASGCSLRWQLLAGIGQVESDHGRSEGNRLDADGVARPGIIGPALNGAAGTIRIEDTDAGQLDGDTEYDHAVGPMQFLPTVWMAVGVDADGDGRRNPQDIDDAALASAVYLCSGHARLITTDAERAALLRYNHSASYVDAVLHAADGYESGYFAAVPNEVMAAAYLAPVSSTTTSKKHRHRNPAKAPEPAPSDSASAKPPGQSASMPVTPPPAAPDAPKPAPAGIGAVDKLLSTTQGVLRCTLDGLLGGRLVKDERLSAQNCKGLEE